MVDIENFAANIEIETDTVTGKVFKSESEPDTVTADWSKYFNDLNGSVFNFVSLPFHLIPEAGCGRSPRTIINAGFPVNYSWQKSSKEKI